MSPAFDPKQFFADERAWQWIKHTMFADYIWPWATIVGKSSKQIYIVDAFAGAGTFSNPQTGAVVDGSPLIAAQKAVAYNQRNRATTGHRCDLICVERDQQNYDKLNGVLLPRFKSCARVLHGDYEQHADWILSEVGTSPVLLLLDPMGLKAISIDRIRPFLNRPGKNDVFLTLHFMVVHRVRGMLLPDGSADSSISGAVKQAENLDAFFGSDEWRRIALDHADAMDRTACEERLVRLFLENAGGTRYRYKNAYPVRSKSHEAPRYWIGHLADNDRALWLCNAGVVKVDRILLQSTYEDPNTLPGFGAQFTDARDKEQDEVLKTAMLKELAAHGGTLAFGAIRGNLASEFFGRATKESYDRNLKDLLDESKVSREKEGRRPKLDDSERIALVG